MVTMLVTALGGHDRRERLMDRLANLPKTARTTLDDSDQPDLIDGDSLKLVPDPDADVEEQVISKLEAARIRRLVGVLPKLERLVLIWRFGLDGSSLSRRAIAERLRLSPAAVRRIEADALGQLRDLVLGQGEAA
jgi:DNA-directed RNA polymerase sigma subunit (sigma70/sigma32)